MNKLELYVFNVGHGLSIALVEYPEKYVSLIDLGSSESFSPYNYLTEKLQLHPDILYITHPHGDHISDIDSLISSTKKPLSIYIQDYNWEDIEKREKPELRYLIRKYSNTIHSLKRGDYSGSACMRCWRYNPDDAKELFGENTYINNSSLFLIYTWKDFKIAIPGDLHSNAIDKFLNYSEFVKEAKNTYILIASHHGHSEGFNSRWIDVIGKPYTTIVSVQENDPHVDSGYSKPEFSKSIKLYGNERYTLTTRQDGHIKATMYYNNLQKPVWNFETF